MGSKIIVFLGILASILLVFACSLFCSRSFYSVLNQLTNTKTVEQKIIFNTENESRKELVKTASKVMTIVQDKSDDSNTSEVIVPQKNIDVNKSKISTPQANDQNDTVKELVVPQNTLVDNNNSEELVKELSTISKTTQDNNVTQKVVLVQEVLNESNISSDEKNMTIKENNQSVNITVEENVSIELNKVEEKIEKPSPVVAVVSPHFSYIIENDSLMVDALLPELDENGTLKSKIDALCKAKEMCILNMSYKKEVKSPSWNPFVSDIIAFFESEKSKIAKVTIHENIIDLSGELTTEALGEKLKLLISKHEIDKLKINNLIEVKHVQIVKNVQMSDTNSSNKLEVKKQSAQEDINTLLQKQKIHFGLNSGVIQDKSKSVLNKIVAILKTLPLSSINIEGHTDASGDKKYNLWLSQQRANAVKKYLLSHGIPKASVNAKGFGSSRPKMPSALYNKVNRRVEIHIKRR